MDSVPWPDDGANVDLVCRSCKQKRNGERGSEDDLRSFASPMLSASCCHSTSREIGAADKTV
jgi:hypothetical protein